jgi:hypothetical protein
MALMFAATHESGFGTELPIRDEENATSNRRRYDDVAANINSG